MNMIIVSGPPAGGKTSVGQKVATILGYSFYSKDAIKERLYDTESRTTHDYLWYEKKAWELLFNEIQKSISSHVPLVIEADFIKKDKDRIQKLIRTNTNLIELYCHTKGLTRFKRYIKRNETKTRHPGHHDRRWYPALLLTVLLERAGILWPYNPLKITDKVLFIDTTDFSKVNYENVVDFINHA